VSEISETLKPSLNKLLWVEMDWIARAHVSLGDQGYDRDRARIAQKEVNPPTTRWVTLNVVKEPVVTVPNKPKAKAVSIAADAE